MSKKWIFLLIIALLILLIWLASITWNVGSINETKESEIQRKEQELKDQKKKTQEQDKKIKQLNKKLESKLLKQQLASKQPPEAPVNPTTPLTQPNHRNILAMVYTRFGNRPQIWNLVLCESGGNNRALNPVDTNGYWDAGLFQINGVHGMTPEYWFNPINNIEKAWQLSKGGTYWYPWPNCARSVGLIA